MINKYFFSVLICLTMLLSPHVFAERGRAVHPERNVINRNIDNRNQEGYIYPNAGTPVEINNTYVAPDNSSTSTNSNGS